jgi:NTP pyrophosphatase (non-canonical NTP hydrolase)
MDYSNDNFPDDEVGENDFDKYQEQAFDYAFYPGRLIYPAMGLAGEAGECLEHIKKLIRDDGMPLDEAFEPALALDAEVRKAIALECGDVLFYVAMVADDIGFTLSEIAEMNLDKLESRKKRGKLSGSGDYR